MCVQELDDSLNHAFHISYRISLRSSSLREPRYPLFTLVLVLVVFCFGGSGRSSTKSFECDFPVEQAHLCRNGKRQMRVWGR